VNHTIPTGRSSGAWYWAFLIPLALVVAVPFYNRVEPRLWGIPFFYWAQLLFVIIGALVTGLVYRLTPDCGSTLPHDGDTP
jgi:Na+-driven multidrug efflux pump